MRHTTTTIPHNPVGIGVDFPFTGEKTICRPGTIVVRDKAYDVPEKVVTPKKYTTKLAQTEVWLVFDGAKAFYHVTTSSPGSPSAPPGDQGFTILARLALLVIPAGMVLADADGQVVDVQPMRELRAVSRHDSATGQPLVDVWQRTATAMPADEAVTYRDDPGYRVEPLYDTEEVPVTV